MQEPWKLILTGKKIDDVAVIVVVA